MLSDPRFTGTGFTASSLLFSPRFLGNGNMSVLARRELLQTSFCFLRLNYQETTIAEQSEQYQRDGGAVTQNFLASEF